MALSDDPLGVSTGQEWGAIKALPRVPVYVTANDLACLYAPLVREGRMDKFFFAPTRDEMRDALCRLFAPLPPDEVGAVLDAFPRQGMDFFGALRSRLVDAAVRTWLREQQQLGDATQLLRAASSARLAAQRRKLALRAARLASQSAHGGSLGVVIQLMWERSVSSSRVSKTPGRWSSVELVQKTFFCFGFGFWGGGGVGVTK